MVGDDFRKAFLAELPAGTSGEGVSAFIDRVIEDYRQEELRNVSETDLARALVDLWIFANTANASVVNARIVAAMGVDGHPLGYDILEIVQPDAPFLVDSVMGELGEAGVASQAMFHPLAGEGDARRSLIQVWLEPLSAARRSSVIENVLAALADSATAVRDLPAMRTLLVDRSRTFRRRRLQATICTKRLAFYGGWKRGTLSFSARDSTNILVRQTASMQLRNPSMSLEKGWVSFEIRRGSCCVVAMSRQSFQRPFDVI